MPGHVLVRGLDLRVRQYLSPYELWGYSVKPSDYDRDAPNPKGKQYPNGGDPNPDIEIFSVVIPGNTVKFSYKCSLGGGKETAFVPGFEASYFLCSILAVIIVLKFKKGEKDEN